MPPLTARPGPPSRGRQTAVALAVALLGAAGGWVAGLLRAPSR